MKNEDIDLLLENGLKKLKKNNFLEASTIYNKVLEKDDNNFKANFYLGIIFAQQKNFLDADIQFKKSLKIEPNDPEIYNNLGLISKELNKIDESIIYFNKAIKLKPNFEIAYNNLGLVYKTQGNKNEAERNFLKAIEINSTNFEPHINLAILYKDLSRNEESEKLFLKIINKDPKNIIALINFGNLLKNIGNKEDSEKYFNKAIQINPNFFPSYNNLMVLYERTNQNEKLKNLIYKAKSYFPNNKILDLFLGHYLYKVNNYKKSINSLEKIVFTSKELKYEKLRNLLLAKSFDKIGDSDTAFKYFQKSNDLSFNSKLQNINKEKAIKIVLDRIKYFGNKKNIFYKNYKDESNEKEVVFLIGFPRSGTTLLDTILRSHKLIDVIEEKPTTTNLINQLGKLIGGDFNNINNIKNDKINYLKSNYLKELQQYVDTKKNSQIIIDKMPLNIIYVGELNKIFPNAKFIFALRHPCDCILSCFMQNFKLNDYMANFLNIQDSVKIYDLVMTLWKHYTTSLYINYYTIKYEDVVSNFNNSIRNLLDFLNISWSDDVLKFYKTAQSRNIISTPSYDQVYKPIYLSSTNRWKNYESKFNNQLPILNKWIKEFNY